MPDLSALKKMGTGLMVELFIEYNKGDIIRSFQDYLRDMMPVDIKNLVEKNQPPPMPPDIFENAKGYDDLINKISVKRFYEFFIEARPDLAEALAETGDAGVAYLLSLKGYIVESVRAGAAAAAPDGILAEPPTAALPEAPVQETPPQAQVKYIVCEACHERWPCTPEQFERITVCPFCGKGKEES